MTARVVISVIMPVRNAAKTVDAQLEALARQSWAGHWELIIADNGSTDTTREVVSAWTDLLPTLNIVDASAKRGPSFARNVGAREANGEYYLFVDADDIVEPRWLEHMAEAAAHHPLIAGQSYEQSSHNGDARAGIGRETRWSAVLPSEGFLDAAASNNLGVRKDVWIAVGGFRESMVASEDTAFCWDAQLLGYSIHRVPDAVVRYRMRSTLRALWRQQYLWGMAASQLYAMYRNRGAPRSSTRGAIIRWVGLLAMAPVALFSRDARRDWVGRAARRVGRLQGSMRYRVRFL
jgi:glycosyltransferase involved in cell wall biosynthesis